MSDERKSEQHDGEPPPRPLSRERSRNSDNKARIDLQRVIDANTRMNRLSNQLSLIIGAGVLAILAGIFVVIERGAAGGLVLSFLGLCLFACYPSTRKKYEQAKKEVKGDDDDA